MDAAQISHQNVVDEHPNVVISGEIISNGLVSIGLTAVLLHKPGGHGEPEVVVQDCILGVEGFGFRHQFISRNGKHFIGRVKGEKLAIRAFTIRWNSPGVIKDKLP